LARAAACPAQKVPAIARLAGEVLDEAASYRVVESVVVGQGHPPHHERLKGDDPVGR
jgi:hypothetical protein